IRADQESRKSGKGNGRSAIRGARSEGSGVSAVMMVNPVWPGPTEPRYASNLNLRFMDFQLIERAPVRRTRLQHALALVGFCRHRHWTDSPALAIAMRIRWQIEQDVFSHERRKVDHLGPG